MMYDDDVRTWEVGQPRSTCEVLEQSRAIWRRKGWRKEVGQREPAAAKRVPDTEPEDALSALERVRQAAGKDKKLRFTALLHHIYNLETLRMAYFSLKKEAAPGVDGETWRHYGEQLEGNLQELPERLKRGAY